MASTWHGFERHVCPVCAWDTTSPHGAELLKMHRRIYHRDPDKPATPAPEAAEAEPEGEVLPGTELEP